MTLFLAISLFGLLILGLPIFLTLIIPSAVSLSAFLTQFNPTVIIQRMFVGIDSYSLLAIPFFIFSADIISRGSIGKRLIDFSKTLVGHLPGGLAITTILTCMFFGAISGAGTAAIVAVGAIVMPALLDSHYEEEFSFGMILTSSTLAMLIPPGITMVLYGIITGVSIGKMFLAGLGVGITVGVVLMIYSYIYAKRKKLPVERRATLPEIWESFKQAGLALGMPIIILGGIYSGILTATEAAAVAVAYVMLVEMVIYRSIGLGDLLEISIKSARLVAMNLSLLAAGSLLSWVLTIAQIPQEMAKLLVGTSPTMFLMFVNVVFLIAGMFIDGNSALVILVPLVYTASKNLGIDPIHLGIVIVYNISIGMITPPFGMNIFIGMAKFKTPYGKALPAILPFIAISIVVLALITYVPQIAMFFPNMFGY